MAGSIRTEYVAGHILTADDLNSDAVQFVTTNDQLVGTPRTSPFAMRGQSLQLDSDDNTFIVATTGDRIDLACGGSVLFRFDGTVTTPVNGIDFIASDTGNDIVVSAVGSDTDISIDLQPKGAGSLGINGAEVSPLSIAFFS
jgi:hypothetical protein